MRQMSARDSRQHLADSGMLHVALEHWAHQVGVVNGERLAQDLLVGDLRLPVGLRGRLSAASDLRDFALDFVDLRASKQFRGDDKAFVDVCTSLRIVESDGLGHARRVNMSAVV